MKKLIIYILILAIVIGFGIAVGLNLEDDKKAVPTTSEKTENKVKENKVENKVENTAKNEIENSEEEFETEENPEEEGPADKAGEPKTDLEKAIDIVKKDWGEDNSVYFAQDGQNAKGEYIICVRQSSTTNALAWYTVNVEKGTFEKW